MADFKKPALPFNAPGLLLFIVLVIPVAIYIGSQNLEMVKPVISITVILSGLIIFISARLTQKDLRFAGSPLHLPLTAFLLYCSLSAAFSVYSYSALEELFRLFSYIALVYLALNGLNTLREIKKLMFFWLLVSAAVSIYGLLQNYGIDWINWGVSSGIFISTFGNKNFFAGFLCLVIPVSTAFSVYYWRSRRIRYFVLLTALTLLLSVCLLMTYSKGAWFGFAGGLAFMFVADLRTGLTPVFRKKAFWAAVIIAALLGLILMPQGFWEEWSTLTNMKGGSNRIRLIMWYTVMGSYRLNPVFGVGMGNFREYFPRTRPPEYNLMQVSHNTEHGHSEMLEVLMELGFIGLGLYILVLAAFIKTYFAAMKKAEELYDKYMLTGLSACVIAGVIDNIVSTNQRWTATALFFWLPFGLTLAYARILSRKDAPGSGAEQRPIDKRPQLLLKISLAAFAVITIAILSITLLRVQASDMYLGQGEFWLGESGTGKWDGAVNSFKKGLELNPSDLSSLYKLGYSLLSQNKMEEAESYYRRNMSLAPDYAQIHYNMGLLYIKKGQVWKAVRELKKAAVLEDKVENYQYLGDIYRNSGNFIRAQWYFRKGLKINIGDFELRKRLTSLYYEKNLHSKALDVLKITSIYMPESPEIQQDMGALYLSMGDYDTSIKYFKRAIAASDEYLGAYNNMYIAYKKKQDIIGVLSTIKAMIAAAAKKKNLPDRERDSLKSVLAFYDEISRQNPGFLDYYTDIAEGHLVLGDRPAAISIISRGIGNNPGRESYFESFMRKYSLR